MTMVRRAALIVMLLAAGCAPKTPPAMPSAPKYPEFVNPVSATGLPGSVSTDLQGAWALLQSGNPAGADRAYAKVLKQAPGTPAALAGLGYVALARQDPAKALTRFDEALQKEPLAAAHVGRAQALLQLDRTPDAIASFEAAQKVNPALELGPRIEALRFRLVNDSINGARQLVQAGKYEDARLAYEQALEVSPDSAVLYRELAAVERRLGRADEATAHLERALSLDPGDRATHVALAEGREQSGDVAGAIAGYEAALRLEPSAEIEARIARLREGAELAGLPEEYRTLSDRPAASRADLAAVFAVELPGLLARAPSRPTPVVTDLRTHWARPWIFSSLRAGVLDAFPNHTFQPAAAVSRVDLAQAVSRVLGVLAAQGDRRAAGWRTAQPAFADLPREHPAYVAAAQAVAAGVLDAGGGAFEPTRVVTGREVLDVVSRLQRIAGPLAGRDRR